MESHRSHPHLRKLTYKDRIQLHERLKALLVWLEEYENKEPLLRSPEDKKLYRKKSSESAMLSHQLSQHALIVRNQLAYLLIDTMEMMEIATDTDPGDDDKYLAYKQLKKAYVKFMRAFRADFRNN